MSSASTSCPGHLSSNCSTLDFVTLTKHPILKAFVQQLVLSPQQESCAIPLSVPVTFVWDDLGKDRMNKSYGPREVLTFDIYCLSC